MINRINYFLVILQEFFEKRKDGGEFSRRRAGHARGQKIKIQIDICIFFIYNIMSAFRGAGVDSRPGVLLPAQHSLPLAAAAAAAVW